MVAHIHLPTFHLANCPMIVLFLSIGVTLIDAMHEAVYTYIYI